MMLSNDHLLPGDVVAVKPLISSSEPMYAKVVDRFCNDRDNNHPVEYDVLFMPDTTNRHNPILVRVRSEEILSIIKE